MKNTTIHLSGKNGFLATLIEHLLAGGYHGVLQIGIAGGEIVGARLSDHSKDDVQHVEVDLSGLEERACDVH